MLSPAVETAPCRLTGALEESLQALACLHAAVGQLSPSVRESSSGLPVFSRPQLDHLSAAIRQGGAAIARRLKERAISQAEGETRHRGVEFWRADATTELRENSHGANRTHDLGSRSLLSSYRTACRALCDSLQEAQRISDTATAVVLCGLLQRLEKQLWLLDSSQEHVRVGLPTIDLFLSC